MVNMYILKKSNDNIILKDNLVKLQRNIYILQIASWEIIYWINKHMLKK